MSTYWITHNDETVGGPFSTFNDAAEARRAIKQLTGAPVGDLRIGGEARQRDEGAVPKSALDELRGYFNDPLCGHPRGQR